MRTVARTSHDFEGRCRGAAYGTRARPGMRHNDSGFNLREQHADRRL